MAWVNFAELRKRISIQQIIDHYGIELRGSGDQRKGKCPLATCKGRKDRTLSVNLKKGLWKCWKCKAHGEIIALVAHMEGLDPQNNQEFREAALILQERYGVETEDPRQNQKRSRHKRRRVQTPDAADGQKRKRLINPPLDFELKDLDQEHRSLDSLRISRETIEEFGIGYCARRGMFQNRIAIPIHNESGDLVAYCGRITDDSETSSHNPLYLFPDMERVRKHDNALIVFDRSKLVYNAHRIDSPVDELIVVEDIRLVWLLYEMGKENTVALLDPSAKKQASIISSLVHEQGLIWFLSGTDAPSEMLGHLSMNRAVRSLVVYNDHSIEKHVKEIL